MRRVVVRRASTGPVVFTVVVVAGIVTAWHASRPGPAGAGGLAVSLLGLLTLIYLNGPGRWRIAHLVLIGGSVVAIYLGYRLFISAPEVY
jgi:hypothetical protein